MSPPSHPFRSSIHLKIKAFSSKPATKQDITDGALTWLMEHKWAEFLDADGQPLDSGPSEMIGLLPDALSSAMKLAVPNVKEVEEVVLRNWLCKVPASTGGVAGSSIGVPKPGDSGTGKVPASLDGTAPAKTRDVGPGDSETDRENAAGVSGHEGLVQEPSSLPMRGVGATPSSVFTVLPSTQEETPNRPPPPPPPRPSSTVLIGDLSHSKVAKGMQFLKTSKIISEDQYINLLVWDVDLSGEGLQTLLEGLTDTCIGDLSRVLLLEHVPATSKHTTEMKEAKKTVKMALEVCAVCPYRPLQ